MATKERRGPYICGIDAGMDVVSGKVEATKDAVAIEMHQGRVEHFNALATVHAVLCSPGVSEGVAVAARVLEGVLQEQVAGVSAVVLAAAEDGVKGPEREIARKAARFAYLKVCENLHERFVSVVKVEELFEKELATRLKAKRSVKRELVKQTNVSRGRGHRGGGRGGWVGRGQRGGRGSHGGWR